MQKFLHLLTALFFIPVFSFAQTFQVQYGTPNNEDAYALDITPGNGFILSGSSFGNGTGGTDAMLTKTDSLGILQWSKIYGGTGNELAIYVKSVPGGGYVFSGETFSDDPAGDAFIARTDANGNLLWWKNYGTAGYDIAYDIKPLANGNFIISGLVENPVSSYDGFIMLADANGDSIWTRIFSGAGYEHAVKVIPTSDNGFLFCGKMFTYANVPGWSDAWLVKTDANGDTLWTNIIGGPVWEEAMDIIESNGGYVFCGGESSFGSGYYDVFMMKTDLSGNLLWSKTYGGQYTEDCYSIVEVPSGGYAMAGYTETFGPGNIRGTDSSNAFVIRTDFNGDTLWAMSYGGVLKEECFSIANTSGGGFALAGYTGSFGDSLNAYIFKIDSMGYSGCNERRAYPDVITNAAYVETHHSVDVTSGLHKLVPVITTTTPAAIHHTVLCFPLDVSEINNDLQIDALPNPASDIVTLQWNSSAHKEPVEISVYNVLGERLQFEIRRFEETISFNTSEFPDGIYFFCVRSGNVLANTRVIIAH
ncbi:MAG: T9SS type A sorting domain-containing protein [Bacteroidia bacterium]